MWINKKLNIKSNKLQENVRISQDRKEYTGWGGRGLGSVCEDIQALELEETNVCYKNLT